MSDFDGVAAFPHSSRVPILSAAGACSGPVSHCVLRAPVLAPWGRQLGFSVMTNDAKPAESLLPYERWTEDAMREVALRALEHVGEHGLPGEHHFYLTFRTDAPGVQIPGHLKARYPEEMTIVIQHQFWDLKVDRVKGEVSVGLSFGGVPARLVVPIASMTAFWDPHVRIGLRFGPQEAEEAEGEDAAAEPAPFPAREPAAAEAEAEAPAEAPEAPAQVVSLDAFRRRPQRD
jgi:uncharacterized protein